MRSAIPHSREPLGQEPMGGDPWGIRDPTPSFGDGDIDYQVPRRRRAGWFVALTMLLAVALLTWIAWKRYLNTQAATPVVPVDPRLESLLSNGEAALSAGDLDRAQREFDRASVLADKDPRVSIGEARTSVTKADVSWLALRLLPPEATDDERIAKAQLEDLAAAARLWADEGLSVRPDDPQALLAKLDALRLSGQVDAARTYTERLGSHATEAATACSLALLDLTRTEPPWAGVVARLRSGAAIEGGARCRAALVYALAKSGDPTEAKAELSKLDAMARPYPLLGRLRAFVAHGSAAAPSAPPAAPANAASAAPSVTASAPAPALPVTPPAAPSPQPATLASPAPRSPMYGPAQASQAVGAHNFERARQIYAGMLASDPNNSEALAGLGDVARMQGDRAGAAASYRRALSVNPSYLPALLGLADIEWTSGDRANAVRDYNAIVDRFPEGTYPAYVKQRAEGTSSPR